MSTSQSLETQKKPANTRLSRACIQCRERKRKCNGESPCLPCVKESGKCTYSESRKRGPPRGYLEGIETRLTETENALLECLKLLEEKGALPPPTTPIPRRISTEQNTARQRTKRVSTWEDRPLIDWNDILRWKRAVLDEEGNIQEDTGPEETFGVSTAAQKETTNSPTTATSIHGSGQTEMLEMDHSELHTGPGEHETLPVRIREGGGFWGLDSHLGSDLTQVIQSHRHHEAHHPPEAIVVVNPYDQNPLPRLPPNPPEHDKYRFEDVAPHGGQITTGSWEGNIEECRDEGQMFTEPNPNHSLAVMEEQAPGNTTTQANEAGDSDTFVDRQLFW